MIAEGLTPGAFAGAMLLPPCGDSGTGPCYVEGVEVPIDTNGDGLPDTLEELQAFVSSADAIGLGRLRPLFADQDGDGDLYDHVLGKPTPDWQGSFGGTLSLGRHLSMTTLFEYRAGDYSVSNLTGAFRNGFVRNSLATATVESTLSDPTIRGDVDARTAAALKWVNELVSLAPYSGMNLIESGDFVRWRELSATYRPPPAWIDRLALDDLTVTLAGRNLALWTKYSGPDPEANELGRCGGGGEAGVTCNFLEATDLAVLPNPRRFTLSVRVVF